MLGELLIELHLQQDVPPWKVVAFFRGAEAAGLVPFNAELNPVSCMPFSTLLRAPSFIEYSFIHIGNVRTRYNNNGNASTGAFNVFL